MTTKKHKEHAPASSATLRDQFACAALLAYCHHTLAGEAESKELATKAYAVADAMLAAREEAPEEAASPEEPK